MTDTANLGLPVIEAAQAQKHVTHNEALRLLDTLVQLTVADRDLAAPPGSPANGERWIVGPSPSGDWAGHAGDIAAWQDGAWQFSTPQSGWLAFVADENKLVVWNGSAWDDVFAAIATLQNLALLGIGTTADAANPFSAKLNKALWTAKTAVEGGDGDLRYTMNKEAANDVVSHLLQTGFSGRAEIGLIGDDNLTVKVSADGTAWKTALVADGSSGALAAPCGIAGGNWGEPVATWAYSSDVLNVDFTDLGDYRELLVVMLGMTHNSGSAQNWQARVSTDNGASFRQTNGDYSRIGLSLGTNSFVWCGGVAAATPVSGAIEILDFNLAARRSLVRIDGGQENNSSGVTSAPGLMTAAEAYNAVRVFPNSSASITGGSIFVYGKK